MHVPGQSICWEVGAVEQRETVPVEKGIWIDQRRLADAGLDDRVEIFVLPGEIRICRAVAVEGELESAWDTFRSLGSDAQPGELADPSTEHDRYLYGRVE